MATLAGNNGTIAIGSVPVAATRSFSVEITSDTVETTVMGTDVRTYVKGLSSFSGSADIYFDDTVFDTNESSFNPTAGLVGGSPINVKFYTAYGTDGAGTGNDSVFQGSAIVTGFTVNSTFDGMVEASISFQGSGAVTFSQGSNVSL
jgi:predicted secreted protein